MIRETMNALVACVATFLLCAGAYPAVVWGLGQLAFPHQAEGSMIYGRDRTLIGSELIAQPFASDAYFFSRPSAVGYKADATGGSNLGTKNPDLRKQVAERAEALKANESNPAPVDLVTASGGGMDPHISPEAAYYQVARVAAARKMPEKQVRALVDRHVNRSGAIVGAPPRVNVLLLNLDLDREPPSPESSNVSEPVKTSHAPEASPSPAESAATPSAHALESRLVELAGRVDGIGKKLDEVARSHASAEQTAVERIRGNLDKVSGHLREVPRLLARVEGLDDRVKDLDESLGTLRAELQQARDRLKALPKPADSASPTQADLGPGLALFMKGDYAAAAETFRNSARERPNDARTWYFAAIANGLATSRWTGETEDLVNRGVERERQGTPPSPEIDAALGGLTKATGRDWLAYQRRRVGR